MHLMHVMRFFGVVFHEIGRVVKPELCELGLTMKIFMFMFQLGVTSVVGWLREKVRMIKNVLD